MGIVRVPPAQNDPQETARLNALQSYAILDTPAEEAFDQLAILAARICSTPMAVVNFLDSERQWFKAAVGVPFKQTDRAIAFCSHALSGSRDPLVVADARQHPLFADNPLVLGEPHIRLYACFPLVTPEGAALGTLAVLDTVPRPLADEQLEGLKILAGQAMVLLELRRQQRQLSQLVQERDQIHANLVEKSETLGEAARTARINEERFHLVARATADTIWDWNLVTDAMWWNEGMQSLFGVPPGELPPDSRSWTERLHPDESADVVHGIHAAIDSNASHWSAEYRFRRQDDSYAWVLDRGFLIRDGEGRAVRMVGGMADISAQKLAEIETQRDAHNHAQLLQLQQRMSSIDLPLPEVLAMVAHAQPGPHHRLP